MDLLLSSESMSESKTMEKQYSQDLHFNANLIVSFCGIHFSGYEKSNHYWFILYRKKKNFNYAGGRNLGTLEIIFPWIEIYGRGFVNSGRQLLQGILSKCTASIEWNYYGNPLDSRSC